jgi:hypothetical protein
MERHWNYRVLRFATNFPEEPFYLEIKEVHYDENDKPVAYGDTTVMGETIEDLTWTLNKMKEALEKPIIDAATI